MQIRTVIVALLLALAFGPALATGAAGAQPAELDNTFTADQHGEFDCEFPIEVEDATGETVTVSEEPEEVVILAPNVAQHMWEIGAEEKVIGMPVNQFTEYLEGSEDREHVLTEGDQGFDVPNTELIVDLDPDLVLSPNVTPEDAVDELRDANQTVFHYPIATDFEDVMTLVERTGQLVGECEGAQEVTADMEERIEFVEQATADVDEPRVFYDLGDQPSGPYTVNSQAFEHQVLEIAGAENIAADVEAEFGGGYPQISTEFVLGEDPEYVIAPGPLSEFPGYDETTALENDQVLQIDGNLISQHAPRTVEILEQIAEELHPEAMEQAREGMADDEQDDQTDDAPAETDDADDADDTTDTTDADDDGPGLTVGAAVAALVGLALIATRRQ